MPLNSARSSMAEHSAYIRTVPGSSPGGPTKSALSSVGEDKACVGD